MDGWRGSCVRQSASMSRARLTKRVIRARVFSAAEEPRWQRLAFPRLGARSFHPHPAASTSQRHWPCGPFSASAVASLDSPANLARPLVLSCFAGREWCGEINEMIWPILRDRRSRLVYGAYSSSPRAKGILRYSQMKEHGLAGCWGVG